ncbi:MAG TPA: 5-formyltetrahydrofolate cyclo-ligase [Spirochaetota bacterium]|nr:5-formyltetrahydrofolate cyclo-ligase [Spirochaetota bacterium]
MNKKELRKICRHRRDALPLPEHRFLSRAICKKLTQLPVIDKAASILAYYPHKTEVNLLPFLQNKIKTKIICFPKIINNHSMTIHAVRNLKKSFTPGFKGIPEPVSRTKYQGQPDIALVPGLGFNKNLFRLGYGGGFYDRFLPACKKTIKIGCFFNLQQCEELTAENHDIPLDIIITENRIIGSKKKQM